MDDTTNSTTPVVEETNPTEPVVQDEPIIAVPDAVPEVPAGDEIEVAPGTEEAVPAVPQAEEH